MMTRSFLPMFGVTGTRSSILLSDFVTHLYLSLFLITSSCPIFFSLCRGCICSSITKILRSTHKSPASFTGVLVFYTICTVEFISINTRLSSTASFSTTSTTSSATDNCVANKSRLIKSHVDEFFLTSPSAILLSKESKYRFNWW